MSKLSGSLPETTSTSPTGNLSSHVFGELSTSSEESVNQLIGLGNRLSDKLDTILGLCEEAESESLPPCREGVLHSVDYNLNRIRLLLSNLASIIDRI